MVTAHGNGKEAVYDALAAVVKAIANGRRLELLEVLAQGEHPVEACARQTGMAVTTTSAHLQTLKRAGLVATRRERTTIHYRLAGDDVALAVVALKRLGLAHSADLRDALADHVGVGDGLTIDPAAVTADMLVLDVRPPAEYAAGHFPDAVNIPLEELAERRAELPAGRRIVLYCRGEMCRFARDGAALLRGFGFDAVAMDEGVLEWRAARAAPTQVA